MEALEGLQEEADEWMAVGLRQQSDCSEATAVYCRSELSSKIAKHLKASGGCMHSHGHGCFGPLIDAIRYGIFGANLITVSTRVGPPGEKCRHYELARFSTCPSLKIGMCLDT